jgi:hypothetical protein
MVIGGVLWRVEIIAEVLRHEDGHEVGGGHRGGRVSGASRPARTNRVYPELLREGAPLLGSENRLSRLRSHIVETSS